MVTPFLDEGKKFSNCIVMGTANNRRTLSSGGTFAIKYFWPVFNGAIFLVVTYFLWAGAFKDKTGVVVLAKFAIPAIGVGSTVYGIWYGRQFLRVQTDDDALYVSNYSSEVRIPFSEIEDCFVKWQLSGKAGGIPIVTVDLRNSTLFGKQIVFRGGLPWNESHSVVQELRECRDRARNQMK